MMNLEKIKRYIVNGEVVHKGEFWRRGRKLYSEIGTNRNRIKTQSKRYSF